MFFESIIQRVEGRLFRLLQADGEPRKIDEVQQMADSIAQREAETCTLTERRDEIAARVEAKSAEVALLPSQIESSLRRARTSQAMRQALELETLRKDLDRDRAELARLEQAIWSLRFSLRQLRRQYATMRAARRK